MATGLWLCKRKGNPHRSHHKWFELETLVNFAEAAMVLLLRWIAKYGIPFLSGRHLLVLDLLLLPSEPSLKTDRRIWVRFLF